MSPRQAKTFADPEIRQRILRENAAGRTTRDIAAGLEADGIPTARGGTSWCSAVNMVVRRHGQLNGRPSIPSAVRTRIIREAQAGLHYERIVEGLREDGIPTAHHGTTWHASTIRLVLDKAGALEPRGPRFGRTPDWIVKRILREHDAGRTGSAIARDLNAEGIPSLGRAWTSGAVNKVRRRARPGSQHKLTVRPEVVARILDEVCAGRTQRSIAAALNQDGLTTPLGRPWSTSAVERVIARQRSQGVAVPTSAKTLGEIVARVLALHAAGLSYPEIAETLNHEGVLTKHGLPWTAGNVSSLANRARRRQAPEAMR